MGLNADSRQKVVNRLAPWLCGGPTLTLALSSFFNGALSIGLIAAVAHWTDAGFIYPSLGATAFIIFHAPLAPPAAPRNVIIGHLAAAVLGWLSLALFGLLDTPSIAVSNMEWARVGAAALALGSTSAAMVLFRAVHPPAAATALVVALGLMPGIAYVPVLMAAVLMLVAQAFSMHRFFGIPYPRWSPRNHRILPQTKEQPCSSRCPGLAVCGLTCSSRSERLFEKR